MAAVTICSDFGAKKSQVSTVSTFPHLFAMKWWDQMPWSLFSECRALSQLFQSLLSLSSRGSLVLLHFLPLRVVSSAYLRLLIFPLAILIPACASSSPLFLMMYFANKLNKQGNNIQPWRTLFPIWNQSVVPCLVLTVASWPVYRFLKRQVRWLVFLSLSEFSTVYCDPYIQRLWHSQYSLKSHLLISINIDVHFKKTKSVCSYKSFEIVHEPLAQ